MVTREELPEMMESVIVYVVDAQGLNVLNYLKIKLLSNSKMFTLKKDWSRQLQK